MSTLKRHQSYHTQLFLSLPVYHTLSTDTEAREADELAGHRRTQLSVAARGSLVPRLWLLKIAQMPLANAAPHQCKQYFTANNGEW